MKMHNRITAVICALSSLLLCSCVSKQASADTVTGPGTVTEAAQTATDTVTGTEPVSETEPEAPVQEDKYVNYPDMKALWISQFDMASVYASGARQRDKEEFTKLLQRILDNAASNHYNTIIYQVRPYADSMYPSDVCPPCSMVTGTYANEHEYDPFEILVSEAHERGFSVQAWINPMRAMLVKEIRYVSDKYRIRQWYNDTQLRARYLPVVSDRVYLNIGEPAVRELIVDGAKELLSRYDVDGLHMDDYFYPTTDPSFDRVSYGEYTKNGGKGDIARYRKTVLSELVHSLYEAVKESGEGRIFGISPAGNMQTVINSHYADVRTWCSDDGYIDYICPQVYFGFEHATVPFDKTCEKWQSIIKNDNVDLIIGMSLGKAKSGVDNYAGSGKNEWSEHKDILQRCLQFTETLPKCKGVAYFCYQYFYDPVSGAEERSTKRERDNFVPYLETISWHLPE